MGSVLRREQPLEGALTARASQIRLNAANFLRPRQSNRRSGVLFRPEGLKNG